MHKMGSVCTDHHHKLHQSHHLLSAKKTHLQELVLNNNIPPRKLISRSNSTGSDDSISSSGGGAAYDPETDPYSSDQFRMFEFKIRRCTRSRSHDWTDCPFAHPGEKARRRDPRKFHYSGTVCPDFRRSGSCTRGDECDFAHGVFEVWLHPSRYRTEACKDGKNCKRKVCFFAHSPRELRVLPPEGGSDDQNGSHLLSLGDIMMMRSGGGGGQGNGSSSHCCKHCTCSPRSTLQAISHLASPPLSPPSPAERFAWASQQQVLSPLDELAYEDALGELMSSLEAMNFKEATARGAHGGPGLWVDVLADHSGDEQQFVLSPSTPMNPTPLSYTGYNLSGGGVGGGYGTAAAAAFDSPCSSRNGMGSYAFDSPVSYKGNLEVEEVQQVMTEQTKLGMGDPDLGWVNDLLM